MQALQNQLDQENIISKAYYDIIIVGGGCAGLSLAYHISKEETLSDLKIMIIEPDDKTDNDKTWCFWTDKPFPFESEVSGKWKKIAFLSDEMQKTFDLGKFSYFKIDSIDFYRKVRNALAECEHVSIVNEKVIDIKAVGDETVLVHTESGCFRGGKVFDSAIGKGWIEPLKDQYNVLLQHFEGWKIKTSAPTFDPEVMQMFDFRIPQNNEVRFVYLIPSSTTEALVEFTVFSTDLLGESAYKKQLQSYITKRLNLSEFTILEKESGVIPMTDVPLKQQEQGVPVYYIGTKGGMCKPSTGYAFLRIQRDCKLIVSALVRHQGIGQLRRLPKRFKLYDALMLDIMKRDGGRIASIFTTLFRENQITTLLRFLDEQTNFWEELKIMASVPSAPFMKSIVRLVTRTLKKGKW
ncbi:lycopene cyclase family protein [Limibacter armeniacum]|uniref:lycopene cyclase family protein n=1 Tax=Limibacter armeniacum TaxID=466084 RepID=UPI002FE51712